MSHPKNRTRFRSLDRIAADPRVQEIWDEGEDGIWISLASGYNWEGCSTVHEWTVKDLIESFRLVEPNEPDESAKETAMSSKKKRATKREPSTRDEGQQILEDAEKAGKDYAQEQVGNPNFHDWVSQQMDEAEAMRRRDPASVLPSDTPASARKIARNMLQQLEWDTKRDIEPRTILELSGAKGVFDIGNADWVKDKYGITLKDVTEAFYSGFDEELHGSSVEKWLTDLVLETSAELRGGEDGEVTEARRSEELPEDPARRLNLRLADFHSGDPVIVIRGKHEGSRGHVTHVGSGPHGDKVSVQLDHPVQAMLGPALLDPKNLSIERSAHVDPQTWAEPRRVRGPTRRGRTVRDYIAVDPKGRTVAGPFADYGEAKREAARARGFVRFATEPRKPVSKVSWPRYSRQLTQELERLDVSDPASVRQEFSDTVAHHYHAGESPEKLAERLVRLFFGEEELKMRRDARN